MVICNLCRGFFIGQLIPSGRLLQNANSALISSEIANDFQRSLYVLHVFRNALWNVLILPLARGIAMRDDITCPINRDAFFPVIIFLPKIVLAVVLSFSSLPGFSDTAMLTVSHTWPKYVNFRSGTSSLFLKFMINPLSSKILSKIPIAF